MDVDGLQKALEALGVPRLKLKPTMRRVAHWVNKLNEKGSYRTVEPKEVAALRKIADLGIISVQSEGVQGFEMVTASLTPSGKELSKDFFMKAYFVKG